MINIHSYSYCTHQHEFASPAFLHHDIKSTSRNFHLLGLGIIWEKSICCAIQYLFQVYSQSPFQDELGVSRNQHQTEDLIPSLGISYSTSCQGKNISRYSSSRCQQTQLPERSCLSISTSTLLFCVTFRSRETVLCNTFSSH